MSDPNPRRAATTVLVVEDDPNVAEVLTRYLRREGYEVTCLDDGRAALELALAAPPDLAVLDIMLPGMTGLELCRRLHLLGNIAIIMLTARDDVADKVNALGLGADDYVPKPFSFDELVARMRAVLRRHTGSQEMLTYSDLELNQATREVHRNGHLIELTTREYDLLLLLMRHPRQVLTRAVIFEHVWGYDFGANSNSLGVYIGYLRRKTQAAGEPCLLHTVRGVGYVLRER